jgi:hypothetical protein
MPSGYKSAEEEPILAPLVKSLTVAVYSLIWKR